MTIQSVTTRSPLRITLGGGGSDLNPGDGICLSATITPSVTITIAPAWDNQYVLHYAQSERWDHADQIQHRILRSVLTGLGIPPGIQISSLSDVPGGTGLGNSGAFTVGLLHALCPHLPRPALCQLACDHDLGQQDQWSATYGGLNIYDFAEGIIRPIHTQLTADQFALYYTGLHHDAADILTGPAKDVTFARSQVLQMVTALESNNLHDVGYALSGQWASKLNAQPTRAHQSINQIIRAGTANGAYGGKLVGAGDGGFILYATDDRPHLDEAMRELGLRRLPFQFTSEGTRCV